MLEPTPTKMSEPPPPDLSRVKLHFKAVGNAPIMRKAKFMIGGKRCRAFYIFLYISLAARPCSFRIYERK